MDGPVGGPVDDPVDAQPDRLAVAWALPYLALPCLALPCHMHAASPDILQRRLSVAAVAAVVCNPVALDSAALYTTCIIGGQLT